MGLGVRGGRSGIGFKIKEGDVSHTVSLFFALIAWSDQQRNLTVYPDFPSLLDCSESYGSEDDSQG
jgi:hypothetical protein